MYHLGKSSTTRSTFKCLLKFMSCHGIPTTQVSDNEQQLTSDKFRMFWQVNGMEHKKTPPYHPASNGQVERAVQELKKALRKSSLSDPEITVIRFMSAYRNTPHSVTQQTTASIIFRQLPVTRFQLLWPNFGENKNSQQYAPQAGRYFQPGEGIAVYSHRDSKLVPATVLQRLGFSN